MEGMKRGVMTGRTRASALAGWARIWSITARVPAMAASGEASRVLYETRDETTGYLRRIALTREAGPVIAAGGCRRLRTRSMIRTAFAMPL